MKKLESLKKLLEVVKQQDSLASGDYCAGGLNCVVGHLLKIDGVTNEQLDELDNDKYNAYGADGYAIASIIHVIVENDLKNDVVRTALENLGFDLTNDKQLLRELQSRNDTYGIDKTIEYLEYIIEDMECNIIND